MKNLQGLPAQRFFWLNSERKASALADTLSGEDKFWRIITAFLNNPDIDGRELAHDIQALCQDLENEFGSKEERSAQIAEVFRNIELAEAGKK